MGKIDANRVVAEATERAGKITKSVLVVARVANVTPANFAKALADDEANAKYLAKLASELVDAELERAIADANEADEG